MKVTTLRAAVLAAWFPFLSQAAALPMPQRSPWPTRDGGAMQHERFIDWLPVVVLGLAVVFSPPCTSSSQWWRSQTAHASSL